MEINKINFILGNKCNSECDHCFTNSTPKASDKLHPDIAFDYYLKLSEISKIKEIHFNGGEPFLYSDEMSEISKRIIDCNKNIKIKVATGCYEFHTYERTENILSSIPRVNEIWASIDTYHLKKAKIENYKNLQRFCDKNNINYVLSICYISTEDLADILLIITDAKLAPYKIVKQPVFAFGRASILNTQVYNSYNIPEEYYCPELDIVSVWPEGKIATCSAICSRNGRIKKYSNFIDFNKSLTLDNFYRLRRSASFKKIIEDKDVSGPFDITSPCSLCASILNKGVDFGS